MCIALCFKGIKGNEGSVMGKRALCVLILIPISTISGIIYSNITIKSSTKGTEKESRIVPFFGILVPTSARESNFLKKWKIKHINTE